MPFGPCSERAAGLRDVSKSGSAGHKHSININFAEEVGGDRNSRWNLNFGCFAQLALVACFYVPFDIVFEGWPPEPVEEDVAGRIKSFVSKAVVGVAYCVKTLRNWEDELVASLASELPESSVDEHEVLNFEKKLVEGVIRQVGGELIGTEILSESGYVFFLFVDLETESSLLLEWRSQLQGRWVGQKSTRWR
jgi:hypothetical protein